MATDLVNETKKIKSEEIASQEFIPEITLQSYRIVTGDFSMENTIPFSYSLT